MGSSKSLYKTEIVVWTEDDPSFVELDRLAQDAISGNALCTLQRSRRVVDPLADPHPPNGDFFEIEYIPEENPKPAVDYDRVIAGFAYDWLPTIVQAFYDDPGSFARDNTNADIYDAWANLHNVCEASGHDWDIILEEVGVTDFEKRRVDRIIEEREQHYRQTLTEQIEDVEE